MDKEIRIAVAKDIDSLICLLTDLFTQDLEFVPDYQKQNTGLENIIKNPETGVILVMIIEGKVIGMVSLLYIISTALGGKVAILEDMIIDKKYRKHGFGQELLSEAISFAKSRNCLRLTLLTDYNNDPAIAFYKKAGFSKSQMIPMRLLV